MQRSAATVVLSLACFAAAATPATAETVDVTAQATAADAGFLLSATPSTPVAAVCVVDTGVTPNADTVAVVDRFSLSADVSDSSPAQHGTAMAMFAAAPRNGFGMVGLWPAASLVSVNAARAGLGVIAPAGYVNGVQACDEASARYPIKVIVLPLAPTQPFDADVQAAMDEQVQTVRAHGIDVVAAAGDTSGGALAAPAATAGVLAVGASSTGAGAPQCAFSAAGARLEAPGCGLDGADPATGAADSSRQGTDAAAVLVATTLAALRSYRTDLTPDAAEQLLVDTAANHVLDAGAAFRAAGLGAIAPLPAPPPPAPVPPATPTPVLTPTGLPRPKLKSRPHGHTLTIKTSNRPRGASLVVRVYRGKRTVAKRTKRTSTIKLRVHTWTQLTVRFTQGHSLSPRTLVRAKR